MHRLKTLRKYASCNPRGYLHEGCRSPSISLRRMLSMGQPSNGVSPLPSDDGLLQLKAGLKLIDQVTDESERENIATRSVLNFDSIKALLESDAPELGQVCEKFGSAANAQTAGMGDNELCKELFDFLKGFGQAHWVGTLVLVLAMVWDRCCKAWRYEDELNTLMESVKDFGRNVLIIYGHVKGTENSESPETLRKAIRLVCESAAFFCQSQRKKRSFEFCYRCVFANTDYEKLTSLQWKINQFHQQLPLVQNNELLRRNPSWPIGETFERTEDTEMVGNDERVEEVTRKLKNYDTTRGVFALVMVGMAGIGKSTVGQHVACTLKREKDFSDYNCSKILMRTEEKGLKVTKKQQELYATLSQGASLQLFPSAEDGRRELRKLFTSRPRSKPVLVYFDDVHKPDDLDQLLPHSLNESLPSGSILLVTSANEGVISVLERKGVLICIAHRISELDEIHARTLLLKKIFGDCDISAGSPIKRNLTQNQLFMELLNFCGGVPLVLNVVGSSIWRRGRDYLRDHLGEQVPHNLSFDTAYSQLDRTSKEEFLDRLATAVKHAMTTLSDGDPIGLKNNDVRLGRSLRFAYGQLENYSRIKELFLEIVAVHLERRWEDVEMICDAVDLDTLKRVSLVKRSVYNYGGSCAVVQVHPLLVGMASKLDNCNTDPPGRRVVVDNVDELPSCFHNDRSSAAYTRRVPEVNVLKLDHCGDHLSAWQLDWVWSNLQYLELVGTNLTGSCQASPRNLKFFRLRKSTLPFPLQMLRNLVILDIDLSTGSNIESIQSMPYLQKLNVENSTSLLTLGPELPKVRTVTVENCPNFKDIRGLTQATVKELKITSCPEFQDFSFVSRLSNLDKLSLADFQFSEFPENFVIPCQVQNLDLSRNENLQVLPRVCPNNRIKKLNVRFCANLTELPLGAASMEDLDLGGCAALEQIPSLTKNFPKLKLLNVHGCACAVVCPAELLQSAKEMQAVNPKFRLIGLQTETEDVVPGRCADLMQRLKNTCRSAESRRNMRTCLTFPQRNKSLKLKQEDGVRGGCAGLKQFQSLKATSKGAKSFPSNDEKVQYENRRRRKMRTCGTFPGRRSTSE